MKLKYLDRSIVLHFNYYLPWWWLSLLIRRISMISLWGSVLRRKDLSARAVITLSRYRWPCIYIRDIKNQNSVVNEYNQKEIFIHHIQSMRTLTRRASWSRAIFRALSLLLHTRYWRRSITAGSRACT